MGGNTISLREVLEKRVAEDPEFRAEFKERALGLRIMQLRMGKGLTQEQLAEQVGMSRSEIEDIEGGKAAPSPPALKKIFVVLGGEVDVAEDKDSVS